MAAVIGALRVVLGADTAAFEDGLKGASRSLSGFGSDAGKTAAVIAAVMTAAMTGFAAAIKSTINEMDQLGKQAQKIGIPVEELSKLRLAADLSGISMEELGKAVVKLSRGMEKAKEPFNEANAAFSALNISVKDSTGGLKRADIVIEEIAERFASFRDGAAKTALAVALFGRAGADMIPLLNQGAKGFRDAKKEADDFGLTISATTAKQAEQFNDNLTRLGAILKGIMTQVTAHLLPVLAQWSDSLVEIAKDNKFVETGTSVVLRVVKEFALGFIDAINEIQKVQVDWAFFWKRFKTLTVEGLDAVNAEWKAALEKIKTDSDPARERIEGFFKRTTEVMTGSAADWHKHAADMAADFDKVAAAAERFKPDAPMLPDLGPLKKLTEQTELLQLKSRVLRDEFLGLTPGFVEAAAGMDKVGKAALDLFLKTGQLPQNFALLNAEMLKLKGNQLVWENREPLVQWQVEMANVELAMRKVGATSEEIARAQEKVGEKFGMTWSAIGSNIAGTAGALSNLTGTFAKENKAMGIASKAFGIGQAIINTQIAVTKALATLPPPASYAAVAFAIAQGAAAIAAISAQGFAMGGSFKVGGSGGMDSTPVSFMATPGERVTVEPEGRDFGRGGVTTIELKGIRPRDLWTGDMLREAVEAFNAGHRDGYRLVFAQ